MATHCVDMNYEPLCPIEPPKVHFGKVVGRICEIKEVKNGFTFLFGEQKQKVVVTNSKKPGFIQEGIFVELDMDANTITYKAKMLNEYALIERGFKSKPHLVLGKIFWLDVGRSREIQVTCIGTPNEMMSLNQNEGARKISDVVVIHNYDYDGFLTEQKLDALISVFNQPAKNETKTT